MNKYLLYLHSQICLQAIILKLISSNIYSRRERRVPGLALSLLPIIFLIGTLIFIISVYGAGAVQDNSCLILLGSAFVSLSAGILFTRRPKKALLGGVAKSMRQILPAVPILLFIGTLSASWMLSGVVPYMIHVGLDFMNPRYFLFLSCLLCAVISVMTGSSWTTIATIGVALMGVGRVMGFSTAWVAGAIISGAYFGDKVSPLSDTTVLAASTCGVGLFKHIKYLMLTSMPAMAIALAVYLIVGLMGEEVETVSHAGEMTAALDNSFMLTPWLMCVPLLTFVLIGLRVATWLTLALSSLAGVVAMLVFQPHIVSALGADGLLSTVSVVGQVLLADTSIATGSDVLDPLVATSGMGGMMPTVMLVLSAMMFGGVMIGTGMLGTITYAITSRLRRAGTMVGATVASGLMLNVCTGDQYLSIIIGGNVYKNSYKRAGLRPQLLSRTLEDSISVTSVLIPWNSCGLTQSTVLGVATIAYMPFCLFNWLSPLITLLTVAISKRRLYVENRDLAYA